MFSSVTGVLSSWGRAWSWDVDDNIGKVLPVINNETPLVIAEIPFALVCLGTLGLVALLFLGHPQGSGVFGAAGAPRVWVFLLGAPHLLTSPLQGMAVLWNMPISLPF